MRLLLLIIVLVSFTSCDQINQVLDFPSNKESLCNKVTKQVAVKLKKELDLYPAGSGGQAMNEVKMLALSFDYYKPVDIEKARELLVASVSEFVNAVNANEKIRPYLYNYPFEPKNIEIRIFFKNLDGSPVKTGKLVVAGAIDGILDYDIRDPKTGHLTTIYKEPFEEAVEKIKSQNYQKAS